jgi:hypothetical protein
MAITLADASEVVSGLVLTGKISPNSVRTDLLFSPYNEVVKAYKEGITEPEELIIKFGLGAINPCLDAVKSLNGLSNADWLLILEETNKKTQLGIRLEKIGKKLQRGDEVDGIEIRHIANQFGNGKTGRFWLADAETKEFPFILTGWKAIDCHLGGFPEAGLIVIGGDSGVGKSTFMKDFSKHFIKCHANKKIAIYSLEMFPEEIVGKYRDNNPLDKEHESRIAINCDPLSIDQIFVDAAQIDDLGLIMVDFVDMAIKGEVTEAKMSEIYLTAHFAAKQLHVPIVLFCQFTKLYQGGLPRPFHIRWTAMAEKLAWMLLMLYRPAEDYHAEKDADKLPIIPGIGYIIAWKIRGGFRQHLDESPGAIQLPFSGESGWGIIRSGEHTSGKWFNLSKA